MTSKSKKRKSKEIKNTVDFLNELNKLDKYAFLGRMRSDCLYFLGAGNGCNKHLWGGSIINHIYYMVKLFDSFEPEEEPEWITFDDINSFYKAMKEKEKEKKEKKGE